MMRGSTTTRDWPHAKLPGRRSSAPSRDARSEVGVPVMTWRARPDMSCEYVSRAWLDFTGCSAEQALGDGWSRGIHPEDLARWLDACLRAFDSRAPLEIEYRMRRSDGEYRWVLDRGEPRYSRDGLFLGYAGVCTDIHERKLAENELARGLERERRLRIATEEAGRLKDGFLATVLQDLQWPIQAIAAWATHLRGQARGGSAAADALEAIERNAQMQHRVISDLLDLSSMAAGRPPLRRRAAGTSLLAGVRVLVADSDPGTRQTVARVLGIAGAETRTVGGAAEALKELAQWRPDVLLSEVGTPHDNGYMLIRAVRALPAEQGGCVRAAALAGASNTGDGRRENVACGYDAQLAKPVEPIALLAVVARLVQPPGV